MQYAPAAAQHLIAQDRNKTGGEQSARLEQLQRANQELEEQLSQLATEKTEIERELERERQERATEREGAERQVTLQTSTAQAVRDLQDEKAALEREVLLFVCTVDCL